MQKPLKKREEFFCSTEDEALDLIDKRRDGEDGDKITVQNLEQKSNKNGSYYRVVIGYSYNTPAGIMETELEGIDEDESEEA
jgi:hypothetical protein